MGHELEFNEDGTARMFYAGEEVPWHKHGTQVAEAVTSKEAIVLAGLDTHVALGVVYGGPNSKKMKRFTDRHSVYRVEDGKVFGVVSQRYQPFQNEDAFAFLDSLVQDGVMRYETAGSLFEGREVWILAKLENGMEICGETYQPYILLTTKHDGTGSVRVLPTTVRVVCNNTNQWALGPGEKNVRVRVVHSLSMADKLLQAKEVLEVTTESQRHMVTMLEKAQEYVLQEGEYGKVEEAVFGPLDDSTPAQKATAIGTFRAIYDAEVAVNGPTAYSVVNSLTGYADHEKRYNGPEEKKAERRFGSIMESWGGAFTFKQNGLQAIRDLTGAKV